MSESLDLAINSLSEQTKKFDMALHFTHGDSEKAREMVAGSYKDLYVIKGKFNSTSTFGAFIIFFNVSYTGVVHCFAAITRNPSIDDIKTRVPWKLFEEDLVGYAGKADNDGMVASQVKDALRKYFSMQVSKEQKALELKTFLDKQDDIAINHLIQKFLQAQFGWQGVGVVADYEQLSSLDLELLSSTSLKIGQDENALDKPAKEEAPIEAEKDPLEGKEIKLVLDGSFILSPIKGKDIAKLIVGDRIRVNLSPNNSKAFQVARAFNAVEGEKILPIVGRVTYLKRDSKGILKAYVIVAKGIYVKILEEEENIKVALDPTHEMSHQKESVKKPFNTGTLLVIILVFTLIVMLGMIIIFSI